MRCTVTLKRHIERCGLVQADSRDNSGQVRCDRIVGDELEFKTRGSQRRGDRVDDIFRKSQERWLYRLVERKFDPSRGTSILVGYRIGELIRLQSIPVWGVDDIVTTGGNRHGSMSRLRHMGNANRVTIVFLIVVQDEQLQGVTRLDVAQGPGIVACQWRHRIG